LGGWHKVIHQVRLENLSPDTQYFYRVGDETDGFTQEFNFNTAPSNLRPFTFALIGDMGIVPGGFLVADKMAGDLVNYPVEFYVHAGDLAYAGVSSYEDGEWEPIWDLYGDQWEKLAAYKPYGKNHLWRMPSFSHSHFLPLYL